MNETLAIEKHYIPITWKQIVEWIGVWIVILFLSGMLVFLVYLIAMGDVQS
jgi:hypothetical protein